LIAGPPCNATWKLGCAAFVDYEVKELATFTSCVAYTEATGRDVYVWWKGLEWKEPDDGWRGPGGLNHQYNQHHIISTDSTITTIATDIIHPFLNPFLRMVSAESFLLGE
jgi:hypothetical protein